MTEMTNKDILTLLEVVQGDLQDIRVNLERGVWNELNALDALITMLGNHVSYAHLLVREGEPF
jgi:hypothetical protein